MKVEKITKEIYTTIDGKKYEDKESAYNHEKLLSLKDQLNTYLIKQSDFTTNDILQLCPMKIDCGFSWYKANNKEDEHNIVSLLSQYYERIIDFRLYKPTENYPEFIGYNVAHNSLIKFNEVEKKYLKMEEKFAELRDELMTDKV